MSDHLALAARRETASRRLDSSRSYALPGVAVAREIDLAVRRAARTRSKHEREALSAIVAERIYQRPARRGTARQVLAWIDRAERMPLWARRESERVAVRSTGRAHLALVIAEVMRQNRDWLDCAAEHRTRAQRQRNTGPMIEPLAEGHLARAVETAGGPAEPAIAPDAALRIASACAAWARVARGLSVREGRALQTFLRAGIPGPDGEAPGGPAIAADLGMGYGSVRNLIGEGRKVALVVWPDRAGMLADVQATAGNLGYHGEPPSDRPVVPPAALAGLRAADRELRMGGCRTASDGACGVRPMLEREPRGLHGERVWSPRWRSLPPTVRRVTAGTDGT